MEFQSDGKTYIYDFDKLCGEQIIIAEQCFKIHETMMAKGAKNLNELEQMTSRTALFRGLGTVLLEKYQDGTIEIYDYAKHPAEIIIKKMDSENMVKLFSIDNEIAGMEGLQWNFFYKLKPSLKESQKTLKDLQIFLNKNTSELSTKISQTLKDVETLQETLKQKPDFSQTENVNGESEKI